jgi:hypothetical protein
MFSIPVLCGNQKKITNAFAFRKIRFCIQLAMHEGLSIATWNKEAIGYRTAYRCVLSYACSMDQLTI